MTGSKFRNPYNQYGHLYGMAKEAWAWEFIRRDPGFRATWAQYMSRPGTSPIPSVYLRDDSQTHDIVKDKKQKLPPKLKN